MTNPLDPIAEGREKATVELLLSGWPQDASTPAERRMQMDTLNGLALEYQRDYGNASRYIHVLDLVNNPSVQSVGGILGARLPEQWFDLGPGQCRALLDDRSDALLVGQNARYPNTRWLSLQGADRAHSRTQLERAQRSM